VARTGRPKKVVVESAAETVADPGGKGATGPAPPTDLAPRVLAKWREIVPLIAQMTGLRETDSDALRQYCEAAVLRARALDELADPQQPLTICTPNGAFQVNPLIGIADRAGATMLKLAERFGLDPASRRRLQIASKAAENPFMDFLNRGKRKVSSGAKPGKG
jgi:P27 family predicted phage terminase small subunit